VRTLTEFLVTVLSDEFEGNLDGCKYGDDIRDMVLIVISSRRPHRREKN